MRRGWRIAVSTLAIGGIVGGTALIAVVDGLTTTDDAFVIDRFETTIDVRADGRSDVVETIDVTFLEPRRGLLRDLPEEERFPGGTYTIQGVDQGAGAPTWPAAVEYPDAQTTRIRIGEADRWLDPGPYRYRIGYESPIWTHVLADDPDLVETRLDVPGFAWSTTIARTEVAVRLPTPVVRTGCVVGRLRSVEDCPTPPQVDGDVVRLTLDPLEANRSATLSIIHERGAMAEALPVYEATPLATRELLVGPFDLPRRTVAFLLLALVAIPLAGWDVTRWRAIYRDERTDEVLHDRDHPTAVPAPPFGWRAPEVAGLLRRRSGQPLLLATLIDLDQRGLITTTADGEGSTLEVRRAPGADPQDPHDREVLDALVPGDTVTRFDGTYDAEVAGRVTTARERLSSRASMVFDRHALTHDRAPWARSTAVLVAVAFALLMWQLIVVGAVTATTDLSVPAGVGIVVLLLVGRGIAKAPWGHQRLPLNSAGRDAVAQARSFRTFLQTVEQDQLRWAAGQPGVDHLHPALALLPYAVALGLADAWYGRFESVMRELAVPAAAAGTTAAGAVWWTQQSSFRSASTAQSGTSTAPSSSGGGGGGGSGGGGGGGSSW